MNTVSRILSDDTLNRIIQIESAGKVNVKAKTSSATGLGQFLNATWLEELKQHRPDLFNGPPYDDELALRTQPKLAVELLARFTEDNAKALGPGYTDGDLYLAHFLGIGTARKFLRAPSNASAEALAGAKAVEANRSILAGKTAGQVRAWAQRSMETKWENAGRPNWVRKYYGRGEDPKPEPTPEPEVVPQPIPDDPGVDPVPVPASPGLFAKLRNWIGTFLTGGGLFAFDWQIFAAIGVLLVLLVLFLLWLFGREPIKAWLRRHFA